MRWGVSEIDQVIAALKLIKPRGRRDAEARDDAVRLLESQAKKISEQRKHLTNLQAKCAKPVIDDAIIGAMVDASDSAYVSYHNAANMGLNAGNERTARVEAMRSALAVLSDGKVE